MGWPLYCFWSPAADGTVLCCCSGVICRGATAAGVVSSAIGFGSRAASFTAGAAGATTGSAFGSGTGGAGAGATMTGSGRATGLDSGLGSVAVSGRR